MLNIRIERTQTPKTRPDYTKLGFGKYFTDHMFLMDYSVEKGWHFEAGDFTIMVGGGDAKTIQNKAIYFSL